MSEKEYGEGVKDLEKERQSERDKIQEESTINFTLCRKGDEIPLL